MGTTMSRRELFRYLAVASAGVILAACQPSPVRETVAKEVEKPAAKEVAKDTVEVEKPAAKTSATTTIHVLGPQGNLVMGMVGMAPAYKELTGVGLEVTGFGGTELFEKISQLSATRSDAYDIIFCDDPWAPLMIADGNAVCIEEEFGFERDPDVFPVCYDVFSWPPPYGPVPLDYQTGEPTKQYGIPLVGNVQLCYCRKDILEEIGKTFPKTWEEVYEICEIVNDPSKPFYGWPTQSNLEATVWSFGANIFSEDDFSVVIDSPEGCAAFAVGKRLREYMPPGGGTYTIGDMSADLVAGRVMMGLGWPGDTFVTWENPEESVAAGKLAYGPVPAGPPPKGNQTSMLGNWGLVLNTWSKAKDEAYAFMQWIHLREHAKEYALVGGIPVHESIMVDPELVEMYPWYPAQAEVLTAKPKWRPRSKIAHQFVGTTVAPLWNAVYAGTMEPEQACKQAAEELRRDMEGITY